MRIKRPRVLAALVIPVAVAAMTLTGCSGSDSSASSVGGTGGTVIYLERRPSTLSTRPRLRVLSQRWPSEQRARQASLPEPRDLGTEPWIATGYEVNDDATEYTFTLRNDVTYSDGNKLDAENVVANLDLFGKGDPGESSLSPKPSITMITAR